LAVNLPGEMSKIREAAGILPIRWQNGWWVYLVQRSSGGRFFPGFHAFPGGVMEEGDTSAEYCAARELWEETGLWVGARQAPRQGCWSELQAHYPLHLQHLLPAGLRTTPDYTLLRFRARFFLWNCPPEQVAQVSPGELEEGAWWSVAEALGAWRAGSIFLAAPTQDSLLALVDSPDLETASRRMVAYPEETADPIRLRPGLTYIPLPTPTLPPARHTVCFLLGEDKIVLVDPGAPDLQRVEAVLGDREVEGVVFTHHHPDHVGGLPWCRQRGWPVWAHPLTAQMLGIQLERALLEGDMVQSWQVLHTPGHACGHLALWEEPTRILLCADLASGLSTILVPPPDGDMAQYLNSLRRCQALQPRLVLPSHGGPFGPGNQLLGQTLQHRLEREAKVVHALGGTLAQVLDAAYADVSGPALQWAEMSLLAHLHKLRQEGRAQLREDRWLPA